MKNIIGSFLKVKCKNRKKFELAELETFLIKQLGGQSGFSEKGGYKTLVHIIKEMQADNVLKEVKSTPLNGKLPPLRTRWVKIKNEAIPSWSDKDIFYLSDLLDLSYYVKHPEEQNAQIWKYILNIYNFMKDRDRREWASLEERSLELFGDEKFFTGKGKNKRGYSFLRTLDLSPDDLKAKKYSQMFVYWNSGVKTIKQIIILENHSTFFSFKRAAETGLDIFGVRPDALIFGQGKRIIKSLSFLEEIVDPDKVKLYYFGDIDPEGFMIYHNLKEKYQEYRLQLHLPCYSVLLNLGEGGYPCSDQVSRSKDLDYVLSELLKFGYEKEIEKLQELWHRERRIPQELVTYEYLYKLGEK